jgi:hypothetical protein
VTYLDSFVRGGAGGTYRRRHPGPARDEHDGRTDPEPMEEM